MAIVCRRIGPEDIGALDRIADEVFDEAVDATRLARYLATPSHLMVLAFDGDLVVGQCMGVIHHHPDKSSELYVDEVGTASAYLRQGIATAMMEMLFAWAKDLGCSEAWLGTDLDNLAANGLYHRMGASAEAINYYEFTL